MTVRSIIIREKENNMYRLRLRIRLKRKEIKCISKHLLWCGEINKYKKVPVKIKTIKKFIKTKRIKMKVEIKDKLCIIKCCILMIIMLMLLNLLRKYINVILLT